MRVLGLAMACAFALGCAAEVESGPNDGEDKEDSTCPPESCECNYSGQAAIDLCNELKAKYGLRPKNYGGLFDVSNEAEERFNCLLPEMADFFDQRAAELDRPVTFSSEELAVNFISEGGFFVLADDRVDGIDGFSALGIDTLVDNFAALRPWMPQIVRDAVADESRVVTAINELGQEVHTLTDLTIEEGAWANAGMWAWSKAFVDGDHADAGTPTAQMPPEGGFFWATVAFNAGPGTARKLVESKGPDYYLVPYKGEANSQLAKSNASWRSATFEHVLINGFADGSCPR